MSEAVHQLEQVAGQVTDVRLAVARLETKLDLAISGHADHEDRLRSLERTKWLMVGAAAAVGGVAGKLVGLL